MGRATSRKGVFFLTFSLVALLANVSTAHGNTVDVGRFSFYQFKLYMTPAETLGIAHRSHFVTELWRSACERDAIIEIKRKRRTQLLPLPHRACISRITLEEKKSGMYAELWFVEDFPQHPTIMRLYSIHIYEKNKPLSSRQKLEQDLLARYGTPTVREQDVATWCNSSEEHECPYSMEFVPPVDTIGVSDFSFLQSIGAQLSGFSVQGLPSAAPLDNDVEIELYDIPYAAARSAAIANAYKAVLGTTDHSGSP